MRRCPCAAAAAAPSMPRQLITVAPGARPPSSISSQPISFLPWRSASCRYGVRNSSGGHRHQGVFHPPCAACRQDRHSTASWGIRRHRCVRIEKGIAVILLPAHFPGMRMYCLFPRRIHRRTRPKKWRSGMGRLYIPARIRGQSRLGMTGHLNFRDHFNSARRGI